MTQPLIPQRITRQRRRAIIRHARRAAAQHRATRPWMRRAASAYWRQRVLATAAAAALGEILLDDDGNIILDSDGNVMLSDGEGDVCCCEPCPDGKRCFQEWIASWDCATMTWSGPVTDNRLCLADTTSTAWTKISGDASGCTYRKYVPYSPRHCCSANGDCGAELGDTATPALPFGGGVPTGCCDCVKKCFQKWTAVWSCNDFAWTGPTPGEKACKDVLTDGAWHKTATDEGHTCTYTKYVLMDDSCCTVDGNCTIKPGTIAPALPFSGGTPPDCCAVLCGACEVSHIIGYEDDCDPEVTEDCIPIVVVDATATPKSWDVSFSDSVNSLVLTACSYGNVQAGSGELDTYPLDQHPDDACLWFYEGTGPSIIVDDVSYDGLRIELRKQTGTTPGYTLRAFLRGSPAAVDPREFTSGDPDGATNDGCCEPVSFTNQDVAAGCSSVLFGGTAVATPRC